MSELPINQILNLDCLDGLASLPDGCVDCCVTSPPYFNLRDYKNERQIGIEASPEDFIQKLVAVFDQVKRVLKETGTLWVNIGDSYSTGGNGGQGKHKNCVAGWRGSSPGYKHKDIIGIPWMLAFALRSAGWYLRQDIIWAKPNPMPESVTDRCTKSHEYIFMLTKNPKYYYDAGAIKTAPKESTVQRLSQRIEQQKGSDRVPGKTNGTMKAVGRIDKQRGHSRRHAGFNERWDAMSVAEQQANGANKRSVWTVPTKPFSEAHFATYPPELIVDCVKAGCPAGGVVLDPFMGAGTTAIVARKLNRDFIGFELNPDYIKISEKRLRNQLGMFL